MRALYLGCFPWGVGAGTVPSHTLQCPGEGDMALMASTESNWHLGRAGDVFFWGEGEPAGAFGLRHLPRAVPLALQAGLKDAGPPGLLCPGLPEITLTPVVLSCLCSTPHFCHSCGGSLTFSAPGLVLGPVGALRAPLKPWEGRRSHRAATCTVCMCTCMLYHPGFIQPHALHRNQNNIHFSSTGGPVALTDTRASSSSTMKHVRSCRSNLIMAMTIPNETRYKTMGP